MYFPDFIVRVDDGRGATMTRSISSLRSKAIGGEDAKEKEIDDGYLLGAGR